tara:strand:+ start:760 stop:1338 length:579 start_codon:yes stop_codon:yes gene_type:complete
MIPIVEKENFLDSEECKLLIEYQKLNSVNDTSNWSLENHKSNWESRIFVCDKINDNNIRTIVESIHYRVCTICSKFYDEEVVYPEFSNLVYWGTGMELGAHADNHWVDNPQKEHYTPHRDYSAVIYLNNNYVGGETFFVENAYSVEPEVGKLILFTSGKEHIHGVRQVTSGSRYTMALWFTKNKNKIFKIND